MPLALDDDRVDFVGRGADVGDDGALGDLPVAVEGVVAELVDADGHAVEVEVGELPVSRRAEVGAAVGAEGEQVDELRIIRVVDDEGERLSGDDRIDDGLAVLPADAALHAGVDVAVQDAGHVVAVVDPHEHAAQGIAVAVLDGDQLAGAAPRGREVHGQVLAVEREG